MSVVTVFGYGAALNTIAEHRDRRGNVVEARRILDVTGLAPDAGLNIEHYENERCGTIAYAEIDPAGRIGLVAVADAAVTQIQGPIYFSLEWEHKLKHEHRSGISRTIDKAVITGAALTRNPASWASRQISILPGSILAGGDRHWPIGDVTSRPLLTRALDMKYQLRTKPRLVDLRGLDLTDPVLRMEFLEDQAWAAKDDARPPGRLEYRPSVITRVS